MGLLACRPEPGLAGTPQIDKLQKVGASRLSFCCAGVALSAHTCCFVQQRRHPHPI
jgi:hypothetical protein